jgi:hypothetical protein
MPEQFMPEQFTNYKSGITENQGITFENESIKIIFEHTTLNN